MTVTRTLGPLRAAVKNQEGAYVVLTGNQPGALLLHYLLSQKRKMVRFLKTASVEDDCNI